MYIFEWAKKVVILCVKICILIDYRKNISCITVRREKRLCCFFYKNNHLVYTG
jgi:hypothetical protein